MQRCLLIFLLALSACINLEASDQAKLESDLSPYVRDDMVAAEAISSLSALNFVCKDGAKREPPQPNTFECARKKGPRWEPQYCIQTLLFKVNNRGQVANLQVLPPVCGK